MSFHEGMETLEEYRYESCQLNGWPRLCSHQCEPLYLIDGRRNDMNSSDIEREEAKTPTSTFGFFRSLKQPSELIMERLLLIEHADPDRLIENLIENGDYGEALRVCKVFHRTDFSDQIHEKQLRLSSSQLHVHLSKIQSRLHVLQLATSLLYPTDDEQRQLIQFALDQATRRQLFNSLFVSDDGFFHSIDEEYSSLTNTEEHHGPLNISQKQLLLYRRRLLDQRRKLDLYDDLIDQCHVFQEYQPKIFDKLREWDDKQIAMRCARVSSRRSNSSLSIHSCSF